MRKEFNFRLNELSIDQQLIREILGYKNTPLPAPFDNYLEVALGEADNFIDIRSTYMIHDQIEFDDKGKYAIAGGMQFMLGKTVTSELKGSERLAFFISTAGKKISEKTSSLLRGEDPVLGYVYDILGSAIVEAVTDRMQSFLQKEIENAGEKITNRYSPGYCNWSVSDQHKLFKLFGESTCGVTLTSSALMNPVKSVSGVIGIGKFVKYREYQCTLCESVNCAYKRLPGNK